MTTHRCLPLLGKLFCVPKRKTSVMAERDQDTSAQWFLHIHPLVWVAAGILLFLLAAQTVGDGTFTWLAPLGLVGFWAVVTGLVVLLVFLLILTKRRPESERR